ncbi:hypothetical protein N9U55_01620 [Luminiphilus sp.]|nr:hypothetical protein [Luminiphilus sp.]MDA9721961.1 hypothetical protein [Luminiphilus sp.]
MFKAITAPLILSGFTLLATPAFSGEITDMEFDAIGNLWITYYSGKSGSVECTVFNEQKKPIGGGSSYAQGGVARVMVRLPKKYQRGNRITAKCQ